MSDDRLEASNPNFSYDLEHQDSINDNENAQSPSATDERTIVPCPPMNISQQQMFLAPAEGNIQYGDVTAQAAIVADVELKREANLGQIRVAAIEGEGFKVAAARGVNIKVEEKVRQRHELLQTDGELHYRSVTYVERRVYAEIVNAICIEANLEDPQQLAIEDGGDPAVDATCSEKCIDVCCQSCVCNFQNPFSRQREKPLMEKRDILTPILRRG